MEWCPLRSIRGGVNASDFNLGERGDALAALCCGAQRRTLEIVAGCPVVERGEGVEIGRARDS